MNLCKVREVSLGKGRATSSLRSVVCSCGGSRGHFLSSAHRFSWKLCMQQSREFCSAEEEAGRALRWHWGGDEYGVRRGSSNVLIVNWKIEIESFLTGVLYFGKCHLQLEGLKKLITVPSLPCLFNFHCLCMWVPVISNNGPDEGSSLNRSFCAPNEN